jgi:hypothetical protein
VRDEGVSPPQGDRDLPGPGQPGRLCRGRLVVGEQIPPKVAEAVLIAVVVAVAIAVVVAVAIAVAVDAIVVDAAAAKHSCRDQTYRSLMRLTVKGN